MKQEEEGKLNRQTFTDYLFSVEILSKDEDLW